eukprot:scaffold92132_cov54-Phaeocystis_antarctica.AAC.1
MRSPRVAPIGSGLGLGLGSGLGLGLGLVQCQAAGMLGGGAHGTSSCGSPKVRCRNWACCRSFSRRSLACRSLSSSRCCDEDGMPTAANCMLLLVSLEEVAPKLGAAGASLGC